MDRLYAILCIKRSYQPAKIFSSIFLVLFVFAGLPINCLAEMYKWVDEYGTIHYGDKPPAEQATLEIKGEISSYTSPTVEPLPSDFFDHLQKPATKQRVIMYSAEWCGVCKRAKKYFLQNKITFDERDIDKSEKARQEYDQLNGRGVPIILVGKQRMNGFSEKRFAALYQNQ